MTAIARDILFITDRTMRLLNNCIQLLHHQRLRGSKMLNFIAHITSAFC